MRSPFASALLLSCACSGAVAAEATAPEAYASRAVEARAQPGTVWPATAKAGFAPYLSLGMALPAEAFGARAYLCSKIAMVDRCWLVASVGPGRPSGSTSYRLDLAGAMASMPDARGGALPAWTWRALVLPIDETGRVLDQPARVTHAAIAVGAPLTRRR